MKTLHFHIGSHKTATTALQNALAANADLLATRGLLYPQAGRYFTGHHPLALALRDPQRRGQSLETLEDWPALLDEIAASPAEQVLLSSENFEWLQDLSRLQGLTRHFKVRVIFYMRSPPGYLESFYNQLVKDLKTRESRPLESYICEHGLFFLDNERLLRRWSDAFGPQALQVRLYQRHCSPKTLLRQFLETLGGRNLPELIGPELIGPELIGPELAAPGSDRPGSDRPGSDRPGSGRPGLVLPQAPALQKISLPPDALEYLRLRNLHRAPAKGQHRITMTLAQIAQDHPEALHRTRAGLLSRAAQQNLIRRFAAGNLRVAKRYLGASRAPFDPDQVQGHTNFDQRLPQGDNAMISKVEALLSRFASTPPPPMHPADPAQPSRAHPDASPPERPAPFAPQQVR